MKQSVGNLNIKDRGKYYMRQLLNEAVATECHLPTIGRCKGRFIPHMPKAAEWIRLHFHGALLFNVQHLSAGHAQHLNCWTFNSPHAERTQYEPQEALLIRNVIVLLRLNPICNAMIRMNVRNHQKGGT